MKRAQLLLTFLLTTFTYAQIPANYYDSAVGLDGYALKTELKNITTTGHVNQGYNALWTAYQTTDRDLYYENDNSVLDIYSENPTGADPYNFTITTNQCGTFSVEGDCYNREHIVPQSTFSNAAPMRTDVHHVYPTDGKTNSLRSAFPFGIVATATITSLNGSKLGNSAVAGYSGTVFEPLDEFKGDIARAFFYFATRYEDTVGTYPFDMFDGTNDHVFQNWSLTMLFDWHYNIDPVDQRDIDRNNASYNFQGNANPFISHPEYANSIWNPIPDNEAPTVPTNLVASNPASTTIDLTWTASTDNIGVTIYNVYIDGVFYITTNSNANTFTVSGLTPETTYSFTILAKDGSGNTSALSTAASGTTIASSPTIGDLYFSEYIEGSGNNKAIEIANFSGNTITDLSIYDIRLSANGNTMWTTTYSFPSGVSIPNNDVYVIANSGLAVCTTVVDNLNNTITGFNGNDALGLFKNGILIDLLGTLGNNTTYASNTTLVRNAIITEGNTVFDINEWTSFSSDTCTNLGQHIQATLSIDPTKSNDFKIYPNPVKGNFLNIDVKQNTRFEIYTILGKKVLEGNATLTNKDINVSILDKGIYIIKLKTPNGNPSKKLIRQ